MTQRWSTQDEVHLNLNYLKMCSYYGSQSPATWGIKNHTMQTGQQWMVTPRLQWRDTSDCPSYGTGGRQQTQLICRPNVHWNSKKDNLRAFVASSFMSESVSVSAGVGGSANFKSYLSSLPIRYEFVEPLSHWTRIHPSSPKSPITLPSPGGGPSCREKIWWWTPWCHKSITVNMQSDNEKANIY